MLMRSFRHPPSFLPTTAAVLLALTFVGGCTSEPGSPQPSANDTAAAGDPVRPEVVVVGDSMTPETPFPRLPAPAPEATATAPPAVEPADVVEPEPEAPTTEELAEVRRLNLESFDLVWNTVNERHYDPELNGVDWEAAREAYRPRVGEAQNTAEARDAIQEMVNELGQSHMSVIAGQAYEAFTGEEGEKSSGDGETGLSVRVTDTDQGTVLVTQVEPGSGGDTAGVKTGWQVLKVGQTDVKEVVSAITGALGNRGHGKPETWGSFAVQRRLTGPVGDAIPATFLDGEGNEQLVEIPLQAPAGEVTQLGALPPMRVKLDTRRIERDGKEVGYIAFNAFLNPPVVMQEIGDAIRGFMEEGNAVDGVIIDVRGNVGGIVLMCPGIVGWFVDEQGLKLGELMMRDGIIKLVIFPRPETYDGPVAVLSDACSVSAAELLAGGFKSLGRGRVFGQPTAGEALPSNVMRLPNGDGFLFVVADYVTSTGQRLEGHGVLPDETVAYDQEMLLAGKDPMIEAAVEWISDESAKPATRPTTHPTTRPAASRRVEAQVP